MARALGVRWTIGDVSDEGFAALQLSIWGAWRVFGPAAAYRVYVNTVPLGEARARTGRVPRPVEWGRAERRDVPATIAAHLAHPVDERRDVPLQFDQVGAGLYEGTAHADAGQWILDFEISRGGERFFRSRNRVIIH